MIHVIERSESSQEYSTVLSVGNALTYYGEQVTIWDSSGKNMRDTIDELKPRFIFYDKYEVSEKLLKFAVENGVGLVPIETFKGTHVSDPLFYSKKNPEQLFRTTQVCIIDWEETNTPELLHALSIKSGSFRAYSSKGLPGPKYCGPLQRELHPLALSSAQSVLALSETAALNASLCNDMVFYKSSLYNVSRQEIVLARSNLNLALGYVSNFEESRRKLDEFAAGI